MLLHKRNWSISKKHNTRNMHNTPKPWSNHTLKMPLFFKLWFAFVFIGALSIIGYSMYQVASGNVVGVTTSTECDKSGCVTTQTVKLATPTK